MAALLCAAPWSVARAQEPAAKVAEATRLFEEGKALRAQGRVDAACTRFEQSFALVHGLGVQYQLARCYVDVGRLASAYRSFQEIAEVSERTGQLDRARVARERAADLERRLIFLRIDVPSPTAGLVVFVDRTPLPRDQWGKPQPIDPGAHEIVAVAPERSRWRSAVRASQEGQRLEVRVPLLAAAKKSEAQPSGMPAQAVTGVVIASVGFAALAAGVSLGVAAKVRDGDADDFCDETGCDPKGEAIGDEALTLGNVATGFFVAGAVLAGAGIVIFFTVPDSDATATLTPDRLVLKF